VASIGKEGVQNRCHRLNNWNSDWERSEPS